MNVMRRTACLVVNPITVNNFAALFNYTPAGYVSDKTHSNKLIGAPCSVFGRAHKGQIAGFLLLQVFSVRRAVG